MRQRRLVQKKSVFMRIDKDLPVFYNIKKDKDVIQADGIFFVK